MLFRSHIGCREPAEFGVQGSGQFRSTNCIFIAHLRDDSGNVGNPWAILSRMIVCKTGERGNTGPFIGWVIANMSGFPNRLRVMR